MAKLKLEDSIWKVLLEGFRIYFTHIGQFTKYMLFPVFGQIVGIALIFAPTFWFTMSIPDLVQKYAFLNNIMTVFLIVMLISLPGFVVFLKAFWDYLVAYGALNSMTSAVMTTGKLYDLKAHTQVITQHSLKFVWLLCVISILTLIAINPLLWVIGLIFFIYFILVFQVYTLEENTPVLECFKRSLYLIKGNFSRTFVILAILVIITHYVLNAGVSVLFEVAKLSDLLRGVFEPFANTLPLDDINFTLTYCHLEPISALLIANWILQTLIMFMVAGLTLPMRSVCWTVWYKNLVAVKGLDKPDKKSDKKVEK